jgi:hypothetical protein
MMRRGIGSAPALPPIGTLCTSTGGQTAAGVVYGAGLPGIFDAFGNCVPQSLVNAMPAAVTQTPAVANPLQYFITGNSFGIPNWAMTGAVLGALLLLPGYWKLLPVAVVAYAVIPKGTMSL